MKKILAFGSSNSRKSINKQLATYAAKKIVDCELNIIDLNDFDIPLYSPDLEQEQGIPDAVIRFDEVLSSVDGIVLSMAEYNGCYTAVFKNLFDWTSRISQNVWKNKPMLLLGASPGRRGAMGVLKITKDAFPYFGGNIVADFSFPHFHTHFQNGSIANEALEAALNRQVEIFQTFL